MFNILVSFIALVFSLNTMATELEATEALNSILDLRTYSGEGCLISFSRNSKGIIVTAIKDGETATRTILKGSVYHWNPANRSFLSSEYVTTARGQDEKVFRTIAITETTQYMVVAESAEKTIECEVTL